MCNQLSLTMSECACPLVADGLTASYLGVPKMSCYIIAEVAELQRHDFTHHRQRQRLPTPVPEIMERTSHQDCV